jgi:hypothetical protein
MPTWAWSSDALLTAYSFLDLYDLARLQSACRAVDALLSDPVRKSMNSLLRTGHLW